MLGRLGELECAIRVGGTLAARTNQPGFDVVSPAGRRISVKTTAQRAGFVAIGAKTLGLTDDLMLLQYVDSALSVVYHGLMQSAVDVARLYAPSGNYELDISKARALSAQSAAARALP